MLVLRAFSYSRVGLIGVGTVWFLTLTVTPTAGVGGVSAV